MTTRVRPPKLKPLDLGTPLELIDREARATTERARDVGTPAVRAVLPARTGTLRRETRGRVSRAPRGYALTISPSRKVAYPSGVSASEVFRFVDKGTGIFGRTGRPIRGPFAIGGRVVESIDGQRAQGISARAFAAADGRVLRVLEDGADRAAAAVGRAL